MNLLYRVLPDISLTSTENKELSLLAITQPRTVLYIYPMTKVPDRELPEDWDIIPGARGCTPQSCAFRDHANELAQLNTTVYGLSSQSSIEQKEAVKRLHLPFQLLSDPEFKLAKALNLPIFHSEHEPDKPYYERMTMVIIKGIIQKIFYPITNPENNSQDVINYLASEAY